MSFAGSVITKKDFEYEGTDRDVYKAKRAAEFLTGRSRVCNISDERDRAGQELSVASRIFKRFRAIFDYLYTVESS